ncbi:hypothetical protein [Shewanella colwelliana]|uniref:Uncharacterized protein n=2 Tax=Shewanella colwelliana TaxID=23 RepID=A0ABQ4PAJ0_SHECO|nr:hypothetical protein [Shewanella colwelliana]MDX1282898.1 hypothetical protein [Shewanella colwelliana]GIU44560.1 hypothetical protein TUM3794_32820 [Shewanella colwelliana]
MIKQDVKLLATIALLIILPLLHSVLPGFFGGDFYSPALMNALTIPLLLLKLIAVVAGLYLLDKRYGIWSLPMTQRWAVSVAAALGYLLAMAQVVLLAMGVFMSLTFAKSGDQEQRVKTFGEHTLYMTTADPGAFGKAYHYFYLQCPMSMGRYELKLIEKLDWVGDVDFDLKGNTLLIYLKNGSGNQKSTATAMNLSC